MLSFLFAIDFSQVVLLLLLWFVAIVAKRLFFHPLSKFPGPYVAACSRWYEFYFDVIKHGTWVKQFPRLHKKYGDSNLSSSGNIPLIISLGPIVRVSPEHLHINEPEFYRE